MGSFFHWLMRNFLAGIRLSGSELSRTTTPSISFDICFRDRLPRKRCFLHWSLRLIVLVNLSRMLTPINPIYG